MNSKLGRIAAVITLSAASLAIAAPGAVANTNPAIAPWRFKSPTICVENNIDASFGVANAAAAWNPTRVNFYVRGSRTSPGGCASVPANQKIRVYYYRATDRHCAEALVWPDNHWVTRMEIRVNLNYTAACFGTNAKRQAAMTHEMGHSSLNHTTNCNSVVSSTCPAVLRPSATDLARMDYSWTITPN